MKSLLSYRTVLALLLATPGLSWCWTLNFNNTSRTHDAWLTADYNSGTPASIVIKRGKTGSLNAGGYLVQRIHGVLFRPETNERINIGWMSKPTPMGHLGSRLPGADTGPTIMGKRDFRVRIENNRIHILDN